MRRLSAALFAVLLALAPAGALAAPYSIDFTPTQTGVSALALNTSPQMSVRPNGLGALTVYVYLTRSAATSLTMACKAGPSSALLATVGVADVQTTGTIAMSAPTWSWPVSAGGLYRFVVSPINDQYVLCTFSGAAAAAGDIITVYARFGGGT